ncbi:hypothetical protein DM02DRAFT_368167 [Periconia macrospinosa]|uniref:Uncharacterized protein n=1 Tax=Periconia macrospinosa TaxID=97972 RepID=A0A2V1CZL3_9PLEO|nr:hypothetical protein DM02DRAFT_368167 [Periconia macrospinosa]
MSLHTFPTQQLQFISYEGPPEPKQSKYSKKTPVKQDMCSDHDGILNTKPRPNAGQGSRGNSTCTPSGAEVIDLTHSINEPNRQLSDEREVDDDLLSYDGLLSKNKCQSTVPKQFVSTPTWEDPYDESSSQSAPLKAAFKVRFLTPRR